ncbi:MAG: hypothetical protein Q8K72_03185, partial [Acidimicrobiales bacterium]|nr:hypothetical protein [Acidimicrobiales bacterium]
QYTGVAGDSNATITLYHETPAASFAAADPATISAYVKGSIVGAVLVERIVYYGAGYLSEASTGAITLTSDYQRPSLSGTCPATTTKIHWRLVITGIDNGDTIDITIDDVLPEKSSVLLPYFDGSTPSGVWSGTAHASLSTKGEVSADATGLLFEVVTTTGSKYLWFAATNVATPLVVPGAWYEVDLTRQVTARAAGAATVDLIWQDVDGNTVRTDALSTTSATDATPVALTYYAKAPAHAARAQVRAGAGTGANLTAYFSAVILKRCPMRLIVVAEDAAGALTSYLHPVHLTCKYTPRYEVAR